MNNLTTSYLASAMNGKLIGKDIPFNGIFNILKDSNKGDAVIRHRIDESGVKIAHDRDVACIITQNIKAEAVELADNYNLPIIICDKIENANAFALKWVLEKYASDTLRIVVTGTNGKSTTTHMIYTILQEAGFKTYTNTDSESEFNTLIDPMVAKQIAEFGKMDALVIEVSEVQGWMDRIMKGHAHQMTSAINPQMVVLTNISLDHIGLVNSIEDVYIEIYGSIKNFKGKYILLNHEDPLIKKMGKSIPASIETSYYGDGSNLVFRAEGIFHDDNLIIKENKLPFKSPHFIQNTLAAVQTALTLEINPEIIASAVSHYKPLERRFSVLKKEPLIIDDFAHNPEGIKATIKSAEKQSKGKLYLLVAIRGSRGEIINRVNAEAVAHSLKNVNHQLIITSSVEVVNEANLVKPSEKEVFTQIIDENSLEYLFFDKLIDALKFTLNSAKKSDTILLIGAQGMDPAKKLLQEIDY